jgi:hypothetical protein
MARKDSNVGFRVLDDGRDPISICSMMSIGVTSRK